MVDGSASVDAVTVIEPRGYRCIEVSAQPPQYLFLEQVGARVDTKRMPSYRIREAYLDL